MTRSRCGGVTQMMTAATLPTTYLSNRPASIARTMCVAPQPGHAEIDDMRRRIQLLRELRGQCIGILDAFGEGVGIAHEQIGRAGIDRARHRAIARRQDRVFDVVEELVAIGRARLHDGVGRRPELHHRVPRIPPFRILDPDGADFLAARLEDAEGELDARQPQQDRARDERGVAPERPAQAHDRHQADQRNDGERCRKGQRNHCNDDNGKRQKRRPKLSQEPGH